MSVIIKSFPRFIHAHSKNIHVNQKPLFSYYLVNMDYKPSIGKVASQVGHASQLMTESFKDEQLWEHYKYFHSPKIVLKVENIYLLNSILNQTIQLDKILVVDKGLTQCTPNTLTVIGYKPMLKSMVPECIRELKLL